MNNIVAYNLYQELQGCVKEQAKLFLKIGYLLKQIRDEKLYLSLGDGGFDTFGEFLENPEIGIKPSTSYAYIRVYEFYIEKYGFTVDELGSGNFGRLQTLLPTLKKSTSDGATKEEVLQQIQELTPLRASDFKKEMIERGHYREAPKLYFDEDYDKWVFEFRSKDVLKIINLDTGEFLWSNTTT